MDIQVSTDSDKRQVRRRRSQAAWCELFARFDASGQTRDAFCREHGLALSTFDRWRARLCDAARSTAKDASDELFIELTDSMPKQQRPSPWDVELQLGEGVCLRLRRTPC